MSDNSFDLEKAVKNLHDLQKVGQELFGAGGPEREARADEVISDWHNWRNCPEDCPGECEVCDAYLCKLIETFAARCANEARLEALEQAAAKVETMKFADGDSWHCFMAPSHEAEELAAAIRALKGGQHEN